MAGRGVGVCVTTGGPAGVGVAKDAFVGTGGIVMLLSVVVVGGGEDVGKLLPPTTFVTTVQDSVRVRF